MEINELVKYDSGLMKKVGNAISVTNKLLTENFTFEQKKLIDFVVRNATKENFTSKILSRFYKLSMKQLHDYDDFFQLHYYDYGLFDYKYHLLLNKSIDWSAEFIDEFAEKVNWNYFLGNTRIDISKDFIYRFKDHIDWDTLSENQHLNWSLELIKEFAEYWNWKTLFNNEGIPWELKLLSDFGKYWDWDIMSIYPPFKLD